MPTCTELASPAKPAGPRKVMGVAFLDKARTLLQRTGSYSAALGDPWGPLPLASVFTSSGASLAPVLANDLGLTGLNGVTPLEAYKVPAVSKAMSLLITGAAQCTLARRDGADVAGWLTAAPEGLPSPAHRMAATVSDLVMHRDACWYAPKVNGQRAGALHLPREMWQLDAAGGVTLGGKRADNQGDFIVFTSLRPLGLLMAAEDTIRNYVDIQRTIKSRGRNPIPLVELKVTSEFHGTAEELVEARDNWADARANENGAVAFTPDGVDMITHEPKDGGSGSMLIDARNAVRLDVANHTGLPASLLEGNSGVSGTYENTLQSRDEFVTLSLAEWLTAMAARISQAEDAEHYFDTTALSPLPAAGNTGTATPSTIGEN